MRKDDVASGEQTKVGARVDGGVYAAFREWVEDENGGRAYSNVGSALERAMLEYMDDDTLHETVDKIDTQTTKNEALLRQVLDRLDGGDAQKVKGQNSNSDSVPTSGTKSRSAKRSARSPASRRHRRLTTT